MSQAVTAPQGGKVLVAELAGGVEAKALQVRGWGGGRSGSWAWAWDGAWDGPWKGAYRVGGSTRRDAGERAHGRQRWLVGGVTAGVVWRSRCKREVAILTTPYAVPKATTITTTTIR